MHRWAKILLPQLAILLGLILYFKVALPRLEESQAEARVVARESAIESLLQTVTVEAANEKANTPAAVTAHSARPRRLRVTPEVEEIQRLLGSPGQNMTDFAGAQHLTWIGTNHKLVASFNKGRLYALTISDLAEEHGEKIYESSAQWQKF